MIFESHAHYDDKVFDKDREEVLSSLAENGIGYVVNVGASLETTKKTIALMESYPYIYGALGVHPSETQELNHENMEWLKEQCHLPKVVAVGEIGLDYYWEEPDRKTQIKWFKRQLDLAREVKLPVIIHSRDAAKETLDILKEHKTGEIGGVIHCFSYTKEIAKEYMDMDFYFGIGGVVTFQNAKKLKEAVQDIPIDRILLETDCPYLAPVPHRGKRNDSRNLSLIAQEIADIKGICLQEVTEKTTQNAKRLFKFNG